MTKLLAFITLLAMTAQGHAAQPAFNCNNARQSTELLLCSNDTLAELDQTNSQIWYEVAARLSPNEKHVYNMAGRAWIAERNACGWNVGCVEDAYARHVAQMCAFVNWNTPSCQDGD